MRMPGAQVLRSNAVGPGGQNVVATNAGTNQPQPVAKRRLLMIAAAFPPTGGSGVQRPAKFAKYLPDFGWLPTVWTMDRLDGLPEDTTLLDDLPRDVTIHRWNRGRKTRRMQRLIKKSTGKDGWFKRIAAAIDWRLEARMAKNSWPDDCAAWARAGERPLTRLIQEESIDAIYSTYSPASNHLLALSLKKETGLPWIADFRDLWTDDFRYGKRQAKDRQKDARLQKAILETADVVIGVTSRQTAILAEHLPRQEEKFVTITNGFDPADFADHTAPRPAQHDGFVLSHVGRLDQHRANASWFEGLARFVSDLGDQRSTFHLRIVGHADAKTLERLKRTGVWYAFTGYESHVQAVREMRSADALLLLVSDQPGADSVIPGKLFEYLAAQRPILMTGPPSGESQRVVQSCDAGLSIEPSAQAVTGALHKMYGAWKDNTPMTGCAESSAAPFSRVALTQRLAQLLDTSAGAQPTAACEEPVGATG